MKPCSRAVAVFACLAVLTGCTPAPASMPKAATTRTKAPAPATAAPLDLSRIGPAIEQAGYRRDAGSLQSLRKRLAAAARDGGGADAWYYLGYADYSLAHALDDTPEKATEAIEAAQAALKQSLRAKPGWAEALALLGSSYGVDIGLHPMKGMALGHKANAAIRKALSIAPHNPRVVLLAALNDYHTPAAFGGSRKRAERELEHSIRLFQRYRAPPPNGPTWGKALACYWLGRAAAKDGDTGKARRSYEAALEAAPGFARARAALSRVSATRAHAGG